MQLDTLKYYVLYMFHFYIGVYLKFLSKQPIKTWKKRPLKSILWIVKNCHWSLNMQPVTNDREGRLNSGFL